MIVYNIPELTLFPVEDRGQPNHERIPIRIECQLNIGQYGMMIGYRPSNSEAANPIRDFLFWFGDGQLNVGDWILLFTGSGTPSSHAWNNPPGSMYYTLHWGRSTTIFTNTNIVPLLFRIDAVNIGEIPMDLPQLGQINS